MKRTQSLDDIALFLAVADADGLAVAARATGASVPTLSRRMAALERDLGERLFERGPRGYSLTARGRDFLAVAEPLRAAARGIAGFTQDGTLPHVRITAGHWTARFVARHLGVAPDWVPQLMASNADVDLARREADIGIRNRRPTQSWLAGQKTRPITYAVFAKGPEVQGFVTLPDDAATTPSQRWVRAHHADEIVTTVSTIGIAADMAQGGLGRVVLPVFAGRDTHGLVQVGPVIEPLTHDEWLVFHNDARHDPPIRKAIDALVRLLGDSRLRGGA